MKLAPLLGLGFLASVNGQVGGGDSGYGPGPGGDEQGPACNPNDYDFDYPPDVQAYDTCIDNQNSNSDNNNGGGGCSDHPDMATCLGDEACMPEPDPNDPLAAPSCVTLDCGLLDEGFCGNYPLCAGSAPQCVDVCGEFASTTPDVSLTTYTEVQDITQQTCGAVASFQIANYEPTSSYFFYPTGPQINPSGFVTSLAPGTTYTVQATMSDGCKEQMSYDIIIDAAPDCTCGANEKVVGNVCTPCTGGETNDAGDDASGGNTECDAPVAPPVEQDTADDIASPVECSTDMGATAYQAAGCCDC